MNRIISSLFLLIIINLNSNFVYSLMPCLTWRWNQSNIFRQNYFVDAHTNPEMFKPKDTTIKGTENKVWVWSKTIQPKAAGTKEFCFNMNDITEDYFILHLNYDENHRFFRIVKSDLLKAPKGSFYYDIDKKILEITNQQNQPIGGKIKAIELIENNGEPYVDDQVQITSLESEEQVADAGGDDGDVVMTDASPTPQPNSPTPRAPTQSPGVGRAPTPTPPAGSPAGRSASGSPPHAEQQGELVLGANEKAFSKLCKIGTNIVFFDVSLETNSDIIDKSLINNNIRFMKTGGSDDTKIVFIIDPKKIDSNASVALRVTYKKTRAPNNFVGMFPLKIKDIMNDAYTHVDFTFSKPGRKRQIKLEGLNEGPNKIKSIDIDEIKQNIPNVYVKDLTVFKSARNTDKMGSLLKIDADLMDYKPMDTNDVWQTIGTTYTVNNYWENDATIQQLIFEFCDKTPNFIIIHTTYNTTRSDFKAYFRVDKSLITGNTTIELDLRALEKLTIIDKADPTRKTTFDSILQQPTKLPIGRPVIQTHRKTFIINTIKDINSLRIDDYLNSFMPADNSHTDKLPYNMDVEIVSTDNDLKRRNVDFKFYSANVSGNVFVRISYKKETKKHADFYFNIPISLITDSRFNEIEFVDTSTNMQSLYFKLGGNIVREIKRIVAPKQPTNKTKKKGKDNEDK